MSFSAIFFLEWAATIPANSPASATEPLLGFDHLARCEPVFAASVLAQRNQVRRSAHRAHRLIELLFSITVSVHKHRQIAACAGCHSPDGAGIPAQYPRIAGQHTDYAVAQLVAFRDGVRKNSAQMTGVAAKMNEREIKAVSDYIAGLR